MKKNVLFSSIVALAFATNANAEMAGDTIVIEQVEKIKIETRDTVQRIVISGTKEDPYFHYVQRISIPDTTAVRRNIKSVKEFNKITLDKNAKENSKTGLSLHMGVGLSTMTGAPKDYGFKVFPSFEYNVGITFDYTPFGKQNQWSIGLGVGCRLYHMSKNNYLVKNADRMVLQPYDGSQSNRASKISVFSLQVPLLYTHYFDNNRKWGVTVGGIVNFNTSAYTTRAYEYKEEDYSIDTKSIGQRPVTVDAIIIVKPHTLLSFYCKYCPMTFFKNNRGDKMHQLSFGVCF